MGTTENITSGNSKDGVSKTRSAHPQFRCAFITICSLHFVISWTHSYILVVTKNIRVQICLEIHLFAFDKHSGTCLGNTTRNISIKKWKSPLENETPLIAPDGWHISSTSPLSLTDVFYLLVVFMLLIWWPTAVAADSGGTTRHFLRVIHSLLCGVGVKGHITFFWCKDGDAAWRWVTLESWRGGSFSLDAFKLLFFVNMGRGWSTVGKKSSSLLSVNRF